MASQAGPVRASTRLRELLADESNMIIAPGVYDGFTARLALNVGFDALYMTGFGTSLSRLGFPDLGLASLPDMAANASLIANLSPSTPLIADADTGYGGPIAIARTISQYHLAGVAALHLEDQVQSKRCGHLLGKELVDVDTFMNRIMAADAARKRIGSDIVLIARTDALAGEGLLWALRRLQSAVAAGADVVFLEGIQTEDQAREVNRVFRGQNVPVLLNLVPGGQTPNWSMAQAKDFGFRVCIVPIFLLEETQRACTSALRKLKEKGTVQDGERGPRGLSELCDLEGCMKIDEEAGGRALGGI